ncbi:MAG: antibiotic biosynthesis monooxygenase [Actinophytocola sp.]|uniref:putative quinol monooxygenase n=1 Tax=Actinophytocola sp. TaxID=1872138 RepID=UPI00132AF459|nr:antibiotic biosynthesis monooxygenase family protein [Actinophytocola sp.]MPZ81299.1 antibiotic biosynthesis monooxygenase [Actinophytocola sp.]
MLIIAGKLYVAPEERDKFVDGHVEVVKRAREYAGCIDLAISADMIEDGRVNMIEVFESEEALASWRKIAPGPSYHAEIQGGDVQKHQISSSGPPF